MNKDIQLMKQKMGIVNDRSFILDIIDKADIKDGDIIAVALWNTPVVYYMVKTLFPMNKVYYVEDNDLEGVFNVDTSDCIYYDVEKELFPDMKFDKIIMNPPYEKNLHLKILEKAINYIKDDGSIVSIQPDDWVINKYIYFSKDKYRIYMHNKLGKHIDSFEHKSAEYTNKMFGTKSWFGVGIFRFVFNMTNFDIDKYKSNNNIMNKILNKITSMKSFRSMFKKLDGDNNLQVPIRRTTHGYLPWVAYNSNATEGIVFNSNIEKDNFISSLNTWLYKYINISDWNGKENSADMPFMGDYTHEWTDEDFYKFFNITEEEQKEIEDTIKKYETK